MEAIKTLLFEDPMALYCAAGFAELILLFIWWRRRTPRTGALCAIPLAVSLLAGVTAHYVVTDRERIHATLDALSRAAVAGDLAIVDSMVDASYNDGHYNKRTLLVAVGVLHHAGDMDNVKLSMLKTDVNDGLATSRFRARLLKGDSPLGDTEWQVRWIRRGANWLVVGSTLVRPTGIPMAPGA